ncbi:stage III sporulation protein AB [Paenibacillus sp. UNCCL117]|uniref:stage III sporulation protein SpoIIIAB n=1 Tax=unclassified Paenibacillus TaxID=185978 RepID=UPI00088241CA|nr:MULTISPECIES: stage III sporulation protein SpoIIIAB [unclassified Paenibacillus]SDD43870.1 stage III sporulation protein AB [Paenibacillus sp. cl123]SFW47265.1 stage III sporulation protein AB [Paenibacillus sp. UNCCL117]
MIKLLGAGMILLAGTLLGMYQASQLAKRPRQIGDVIRLLQRLETEIVYGFTPLPAALRTTGQSSSTEAGALFVRTGEQLASSGGRPVQLIWQETVTSLWKDLSMKQGEKEVLLQFGATLGLTDRDDQVKHVRLAINQLQSEEEGARDEQRRYERMWKSLGLLVGALIVVLMY